MSTTSPLYKVATLTFLEDREKDIAYRLLCFIKLIQDDNTTLALIAGKEIVERRAGLATRVT